MSATRFSLEHFYYGQVVSDHQPQGRPLLLAASPGITPEIASAAVELGTLPVGQRPVWAVVRGNRQFPFLLIHARRGADRQLMSHYILFTSDALRAIGGNLRFLMTLIPDELPTYSTAEASLPVLEITTPASGSTDQEIEDILELMTLTRNRLEVMESLLASVVRNTGIIIQGAPLDQKVRLDFISGLLALLPPSVRFAVTFATHSLAATGIDVQIRFYSDEEPPAGIPVYHWDQGTLTGPQIENDDYSRFVISQLRLDTSLVIDNARALTQTAGWRMKQGDRLKDALAYSSHRQSVDTALLNNQPVNKEDVARILSEDPTLDENLRVLYGRHLLTFSLAMDDVQHADPLIELLGSTPELERAAYRQMTDTLENKQAFTVYRMVARWLGGTHLQNEEPWVDLAHRAALIRLDELIKNNSLDALYTLVADFLDAAPAVHLERIAGKLLEKILPLTPQDAALAENAFLLAAEYMDTPRFKRLLEVKPFISQLDPGIPRLQAYLNGGDSRIAPAGLMLTVAKTFGEQWEGLVLLRFAEIARQAGRFDMLDEATLQGTARLATSPEAQHHYERLYLISERPSESELTLLGAKAAQYLLQIRLVLGDYPELAAQMLQQSSALYRGDLQIDYIKMVEQLFAGTKISAQQVATALSEISQNGIKSAPLIMAQIGALQNRPPDVILETIAEQVAHALLDEPRMLNVIPPASILHLLEFHVRHDDPASAIEVAGLVSTAAASSTEGGMKITGEMYRLMATNRKTQTAAQHILRVFIQEADDKTARQAVIYYGRELGNDIRLMLEATLLVKQLTGGRNLETYAQQVHRTVNFLQDAAAAYEERNLPTIDDLMMKLTGMRDSLQREERLIFTRALMGFMKGIVALYQQQRSTRSLSVDRLLNGSIDPVTGLDVVRVIAGSLGDARRVDLKLRASLPNPLGDRTRKFLQEEILAGNEVISGIQRAVPVDTALEVKTAQLREAIITLKNDLDEATRREVARTLPLDLQKLAALIELIAEKGDPKALEDGLGSRIDDGRQRPRSALEFMRFVYGYHLTRG